MKKYKYLVLAISVAIGIVILMGIFIFGIITTATNLPSLRAETNNYFEPSNKLKEQIAVLYVEQIIYVERIVYVDVYVERSVYYTINLPLQLETHELQALYRIVYAEARGEGIKGMTLVANVIFNRLNHPNFPNDIIGVIFQGATSNSNGAVQFAPTVDGSFFLDSTSHEAIIAVHNAINGIDYSQGALFFRTIAGAEGNWHENNLQKLFDYGGHRFYE